MDWIPREDYFRIKNAKTWIAKQVGKGHKPADILRNASKFCSTSPDVVKRSKNLTNAEYKKRYTFMETVRSILDFDLNR